MLQAGSAVAHIDPSHDVPHAGWGAQTHVLAAGRDDHLTVSALYAGDGQREVLILDYDLCVLSMPQADAIRQAVARSTGISAEAVCIRTTHNHAGPMIEASYYQVGDAAREAYLQSLVYQGTEVATWAKKKRRAARVAVGHGTSSIAKNRRQRLASGRVVTGCDPDGVVDPEVTVIRVDGVDGSPIAAVLGYACHATTLGPPNTMVSADYPGAAKRLLAEITGATVLFLQGAAGNVGPGFEGFTGDVSVAHRLGRILACEAARVYEETRTQPVRAVFDRVVESGAPLGVFRIEPEALDEQTVDYLSTPLALPVDPQVPIDEAIARADEAAKALRDLQAQGADDAAIADATFRAKRASMAARRSRDFYGSATKDVELQLLRIGPAVVAGIPAEPFCQVGLAIKAASPFTHTFFGGYTNGCLAYIPTADAYPLGGYEVDTTPFSPEAADAVVAGTLAALARFAG